MDTKGTVLNTNWVDKRTHLDIQSLSQIATARAESFFNADVLALYETMRSEVRGKRVLVVGGAGTIGSATTDFISAFEPASLHVVDQNENALAELTRHLRSRAEGMNIADFRTFPIDYGSPIMRVALDTTGNHDLVLNFAALKHVRSEKDVPSLLQMLDTNLVKNRFLMRELAERGFEGRYFCVSTDKAANPVNLMGASKRVMEHLIFSRRCTPSFNGKVTSARFANVAFSDGSLLQSFIHRLAKRQPLAAPRATERYFVSPGESGEICAVAALTAPADTIVVPKLDPRQHLKRLEDVAIGFLKAHGLTPDIVESEAAARMTAATASNGSYPLLLTSLDTSGEKPYEEFVGRGETARDLGLQSFSAVDYLQPPDGSLEQLLDLVDAVMSGKVKCDKAKLVQAIAAVVPELQHRETGRNLDQRM